MIEPESKARQFSSKSKQEVEQYIIELLTHNGKLTTQEILAQAELDGITCPDEPVRLLNVLKQKGVIQGQLSLEHKRWFWWV